MLGSSYHTCFDLLYKKYDLSLNQKVLAIAGDRLGWWCYENGGPFEFGTHVGASIYGQYGIFGT